MDEAEAIPDDVATDRGGLILKEETANPLGVVGARVAIKDPTMGYSARANETARKAAAGELLSRRSLMGAMDHALEVHASALRLLEAKIVALQERVAKLEATRSIQASDVAAPVTQCGECGAVSADGSIHVHEIDGGTHWVPKHEQT